MGTCTQDHAALQARLQSEVHKAQLESEAAGARHIAELAAVAAQAAVERARNEVAAAKRNTLEEELRITELEMQRLKLSRDLDISTRRQLKDIENTVSDEAIQLAVARQLPQIAAGFAQKMGNVNVTAIDGANPFGFVAAAVEGVMGLAKSAGLRMPEVQNGQPPKA